MLNDTVDRPLKETLLKICLVPIFIMLLFEITQLSTYFAQKRKENVSIYKHYGIVFVMLFFLYAIPELMGVFTEKSEQERLKKNQWNPNEVLPELMFTILVLSFIRLLQYIRVYDEFGFFIDMFISCLIDLKTFIISFIGFLVFFTFCYI